MLLAMLLALALALSAFETAVLPPLGVPGAKWGLANIVTLLLLVKLGFSAALAVAAVRVILVSFFAGSFLGLGFWLSAAGALVSLVVMWALLRSGGFSLLGISVAGAVSHNLAQLGTYSIVVGSSGVFYLLPPLLLVSLLTGAVTGMAVKKLRQY